MLWRCNGRPDRAGGWVGDDAEREHLGEDRPHGAVETTDRDRAARHHFGEVRRNRLDQVHPGVERCRWDGDSPVVGPHEPGEADLFEYVQYCWALARIDPVDLSKCTHDRCDMTALHRCSKRSEVHLLEGPERQQLVQRRPSGLLGIGGEVLGLGHDLLRLDALDLGHRHRRGEVGIFAVGLEERARWSEP